VGDIFKIRCSEAKDNLEGKTKTMAGSGLGLKTIRNPRKGPVLTQTWVGEGYFHRGE